MNSNERQSQLTKNDKESRHTTVTEQPRQTMLSFYQKIDKTKVTKSGFLYKRGNILSGFSSKYYFYLEDNILKYGKKGKDISYYMDVKSAKLKIYSSSKRKFDILQGKKTLKLRADNEKDRQEWIDALSKFTVNTIDSLMRESQYKNNTNNNNNNAEFTSMIKKISLQQISDQLQNNESRLNQAIDDNQESYRNFLENFEKFQFLLTPEQKDQFMKTHDAFYELKSTQKTVIDLVTEINQSLFDITENIAKKEIERDPLEFIRRESQAFRKDSGADGDAFERFKSLHVNNANFIMPDFEEEESKGSKRESMRNKNNQMQFQFEAEQLMEDLDDVFYDAQDFIQSRTASLQVGLPQPNGTTLIEMLQNLNNNGVYFIEPEALKALQGQTPDPTSRECLPYFKDPKIKFSVWAILKDLIGKDITKISLPVFLNAPINVLQRAACSCEYNELMDQAVTFDDSLLRLAYIAIYTVSCFTSIERSSNKPFNPLLGETYELMTPKFKFFGEVVSHHPPIVAYNVQGNSGYIKHGLQGVRKPQLSHGSITVRPVYKDYIELPMHNETYLIQNPSFSMRNLIIGTPYIDIKEKLVVKNLSKQGEYAVINFHERGWKQSSYFRIDGEVYNSNKQIAYRIEGKWSDSIWLTDVKTGEKTQVWKKHPYPENWAHQYGFTTFTIQLNYLPNFLKSRLPHTDTRLRPDQRALENGDLKLASLEKDKVEEKQRLVRRYREKNEIQPKNFYFEPYQNMDENGEIYYKYNGLYWEKERKEQNWSRLPDIFTDELPPEIEEFKRKHPK